MSEDGVFHADQLKHMRRLNEKQPRKARLLRGASGGHTNCGNCVLREMCLHYGKASEEGCSLWGYFYKKRLLKLDDQDLFNVYLTNLLELQTMSDLETVYAQGKISKTKLMLAKMIQDGISRAFEMAQKDSGDQADLSFMYAPVQEKKDAKTTTVAKRGKPTRKKQA